MPGHRAAAADSNFQETMNATIPAPANLRTPSRLLRALPPLLIWFSATVPLLAQPVITSQPRSLMVCKLSDRRAVSAMERSRHERSRKEILSPFAGFPGVQGVMNKHIPLLVAGLWLAGSMPSSGQSPVTNYTALYVFGHSRDATAGGPYWQGRFSNGPMWPELLSTNLGFPYQPQNNRAVGGATSSQILAQVRSLSAPTNAGAALFMVEVGHMDFFGLLQTTNNVTWSNATRVAVLNWSNSVAECYWKGARTVVALNMIDFYRYPAHARTITNPAYVRGKAIEANAAYKAARDRLTFDYPDLRLVPIDEFGFGDVLVTNHVNYGFTRIDLGATEDPLLSDKGYGGPGKDYFFWDGGHVTSKAHALLADMILAALRGARMAMVQERDGFRLRLEPLQPGRMYHLQQSADLMHWEDITAFPAARFAWDTVVAFGTGPSFYRLTSDE